MLLVFKTAVHTGFSGGNLGFTSGFTEAQKIIISESVIFCPRIFSETRWETAWYYIHSNINALWDEMKTLKIDTL